MKRTRMSTEGVCDYGCGRPIRARRMCTAHYARWAAGTDPGSSPIKDKKRGTPTERFAKYVDRSGGPDACHIWTGVKIQGYGQFRVSTEVKIPAHVYAWEEVNGPVPDGLVLDHKCHPVDGTCGGGRTCQHRACVNPAHLGPETRGDNARRCVPVALRWAA